MSPASAAAIDAQCRAEPFHGCVHSQPGLAADIQTIDNIDVGVDNHGNPP